MTSTGGPPPWFDRGGMQAWTEGMAKALRRRVAIIGPDDAPLISAGTGQGEPVRIPFQVNGVNVASVEITPGELASGLEILTHQAVGTLQSFADARNSMTDLVKTTAHQWRELSLLYRFSDLIAGLQDPDALANLLMGRANRALHCQCGAIVYRSGEGESGFAWTGDGAAQLRGLTEWGARLESGMILTGIEGAVESGFEGSFPGRPVLVVPLRCRDRNFGALAAASENRDMFTAEDLKLASLLARQAGLAFANLELIDQAREHERLRRELEVAAEIQASIMPPQVTETERFEVAGTCLPAQWVGGDTFFVLPQDDGLLAGVADVSGHGLSSALLMNAFASEIEALSFTHTYPAELLRITNRLVCARVGAMGLFVTVVLLRYWSDGSVSIANAGHPPPMVITPTGSIEMVTASSLPLGILEDESFEDVRLEASQQEVIATYSDGITEAVAPDGTMFGMGRLRQSLGAAAPDVRGAVEVRDLILEDLSEFEAGQTRSDDLTLLVVRRKQ